MKTPYAVFLILFCILASFGNIMNLFLMEDFGPGFIQYYNSYPGIVLMQWVSLVFDVVLIFCVFISIYIRDKQLENSRIILIVPLMISFMILWVELLYSSFEIFGFGKHQDPFGGNNNLGLFGSFVLSLYMIYIIFDDKPILKYFKYIVIGMIIVHLFLLYLLVPGIGFWFF